MMDRLFLLLLLIAIALMGGSTGQRRTFPTPPAPAEREAPPTSPPAKLHDPRMDSVTMEREAKEMAALAASIPGDIEQMKKGLLPSDAFDKLKRIEKLSRDLRSQIRR